MITIYLKGHNYEYEARNAIRIFDLNIDIEFKTISDLKEVHSIKKDTLDKSTYILTVLEKQAEQYVAKTSLYINEELLCYSSYNSSEIIIENNDEKKLKKTLVQKSIHDVLKKHYNFEPDYGILTGVRVVKIILFAKKCGRTNEEINRILLSTYEVKKEKIDLLWEILNIEEKYIDEETNKQNYNLYISIPFCPSKCTYCSFTSFVNCKTEKIEKYLEILFLEIEKTVFLAKEKNLKLNTIYIGGGTPSVLSEEQIERLLKFLGRFYDLRKIREITFEAGRCDTITEEKLKILKDYGVERISINPQSMNEKTLKSVNRNHANDDFIIKYKLARQIGFKSINMDLILGLPGESLDDFNYSLEEVFKLTPDNITFHVLSYKRKSMLSKESDVFERDYFLIKNMQDLVFKYCKQFGYKPYYMYRQKNIKGNLENLGFSLTSKECIYNMVMIEEMETILACGINASSKIMINENRHEPVHNFKSYDDYISRIDELIEKKKNLL